MLLQEHLLIILAEECSEVAHRASKALRFGLREVQKGQTFTNAERIIYEFSDLYAVMRLLYAKGLIPQVTDQGLIDEKMAKIQEFLEYSRKCGTLTE